MFSSTDQQSDAILFFANLISPHDEDAYDLLEWVLTLQLKSDQGSFATEFSKSLISHFRAAPALVRYGSAICLYTLVEAVPNFLAYNKNLTVYIVSGLLDSDNQTARLYASLLRYIDLKGKLDFKESFTYDHLYKTNMIPAEKVEPGTQFLDAIIQSCPPVESSHMYKVANAIEYLPFIEKRNQLRLIKYLARTGGKIDTYILQIVAPLCSSSEEYFSVEAINAVSSLISGSRDLKETDFALAWKFIAPKLVSSSSYVLFKLTKNILAACLKFIESIIQKSIMASASSSRVEIMQSLVGLFFCPSAEIRLKVYTFLGLNFTAWDLCGERNTVFAMLLLALGDNDHIW